MSNLERARKGNGSILVSSKGDRDYLLSSLSPEDARELHNWINQQINYAVTHAIDDTPDPVYWRDLGPDEIRQEGDRVFNGDWSPVESTVGLRVGPATVQRPVRKEDL